MLFHSTLKKTIFSLSCFCFMQGTLYAGSVEIPSELLEEAKAKVTLAQSLKLDDHIPAEVRTIWRADKATKELKSVPDLGTGVMRGFKVENEIYVFAGKRFGQFWKIGIGGTVEEEDSTLREAIRRELEEEYFGQVPLTEKTEFFNAAAPHRAGGIVEENDKLISKEWGPYFTFFALEETYNLEQLKACITPLNINGSYYTELNNLFAKFNEPYEKLDPNHRQTIAHTLLQKREDFLSQAGFIDVQPIVRETLENLSQDGSYDLGMTGFLFAKQYIHPWSEYSEFKLFTFKDFLSQPSETLFKAEEGARKVLQSLMNIPQES